MDEPEIIDTEELTITIDGEQIDIGEVWDGGYLPTVAASDDPQARDWHVAEDRDMAGAEAVEYWRDLATDDPAEFRCIVGDECLIRWALGQSAGPGTTNVNTLEEWFELHRDCPEEDWASYDGQEWEVEAVSQGLIDELGFTPTVAYRHN